MRVLAIETATGTAAVAVLVNGEPRAEASRTARDHAASLPELVETALVRAGLRAREVELIAVSGGPGSFTGLRIGLSFAKGAALAIGAPVVAVPTLEVLALSAGFEAGRLVPVLDARRGEVYWAEFAARGPARVESCGAGAQAMPVESFLEQFTQPAALIGEGVAAYRQRIEARVPAGSTLHPDVAPRAVVVARLGIALYERDGALDLPALEPAYVAVPNIRLPAPANRCEAADSAS